MGSFEVPTTEQAQIRLAFDGAEIKHTQEGFLEHRDITSARKQEPKLQDAKTTLATGLAQANVKDPKICASRLINAASRYQALQGSSVPATIKEIFDKTPSGSGQATNSYDLYCAKK